METFILNFIYKNSEEGKKTTRDLIDISNNPDFIKLLTNLHERYEEKSLKSYKLLQKTYTNPEEISSIESIASYLMIKISTIRDKSSSNIASILIRQSTEGIKELNNYIFEYKEKEIKLDDEMLKFAEEYISFEKENICDLEKYL